MRFHRLILGVAILSATSIAACGDSAAEGETPVIDSSKQIVPLPMQGDRTGDTNSANIESFEEMVYRSYARLAVSLPRREMDSIIKSVPPLEIEEQMTKRLRIQDTIARGRIADEYHIARDSVNAILARRNVPTR